MSMNTYPLQEPLAFAVDEAVAIWVNLAAAKTDGAVPSIVKKLLDEHRFDKLDDPVVKEILDEEDFLSIADAHDYLETLGISNVYCSQFDGEMNYLTGDGGHYARTVEFRDDYIAYVPAASETSPFKTAYGSVDGFVAEIKAAFHGKGVFPDGFDYAAHVVAVSGTYVA